MPKQRWKAFIWYSSARRENRLRRLGEITSLPAFCRKPQGSKAAFTASHRQFAHIRPLYPSPKDSFRRRRLQKA